MKKETPKIDQLSIEELQVALTGCQSEDPSEIEQALYDQFGIDAENFELLIESLFKMMTFDLSDLTGTAHVGFGKDGIWSVKKDVTNEYIGSVIKFILDGQEFVKGADGYSRIITNKGEPEYNLIITKPEFEVKINQNVKP